MDSLLTWALWIIATAVEVSPGLALLMAGPIGRFLRRVLFVRGQGGGAVVANRSGSGSEAHADYHSPSCGASLRGPGRSTGNSENGTAGSCGGASAWAFSAPRQRGGPTRCPAADSDARPLLRSMASPGRKARAAAPQEEFLAALAVGLDDLDPIDSEDAARAVFAVLEHHIAPAR